MQQEGEGRAPARRGDALWAALAGSVAGAGLQLQQPALWPLPAYGLAVTAGVLLAWLPGMPRQGAAWIRVLLALLAATALGLGLTGLRAWHMVGQALPSSLEARDLEVVGVVAQMPQHGEAGLRFRLDVESMRWAGSDGELPAWTGRVALGWYAQGTALWGRGEAVGAGPAQAPGPLHAGERWRMTVRLKQPHGNLNPHGFDYELWLWEQGVHATGYVRTGTRDAAPQRLGQSWRHPIERAREAVRDAIFARVDDRAAAGVLAALVTGDQAAIERADWDVFRATGVAHLMSISGLHVTMFAWLAIALVGWLWRRSARLVLRCPAPQAALAGGVLLAAAYALFSGWGLPAQRTVWMLALVALLRARARRWPWPVVWLATLALVVALDPWALLQAGFWLSFVAVGVLFATNSGASPARGTGAAAQFGQMVREQWAVSLALAPLGLLLFHQLSLVGFAANLLAIPWVTLVVVPLGMLGVAVPALWFPATWAVQGLATLLQAMAAWPWATLALPAPPLLLAALAVLGGAALAARLPWALRLLGLPLVLPALLWLPARPAPGQFEVLGVDVGQGNAVLLRTARHSLLYDAGPRYSLESDAGHRVLVPLLRAGGERLDLLVLSHRDQDHTGGAPAILAMQPSVELLGSLEPAHPLWAGRTARRCEAGQQWQWDGVRFTVLHPPAADHGAGLRPNALSCVLRVDNGQAAVLLAGDIERAQEAALLARGADLRADLLLVPHHGSRTSSSAPWLQAVQPRLALIQAGWRNRFGHPAPEVRERLAAQGAVVAQSARCGAALWQSEQPQALRCWRHAQRRYWHHLAGEEPP